MYGFKPGGEKLQLKPGGTSTNLKIAPDILHEVAEARANKIRAIKVVVDAKAETLTCASTVPEGDSLAEDFEDVQVQCEDGAPCLMLIRLKGSGEGPECSVEGADENAWALLAWTPEDSPVKLKMLSAASRKTLMGALKNVTVKEWPCTDRDDVKLEDFLQTTKPMSKEDKHMVMSREEIDREEVNEAVEKQRMAAPKMLAGLVALKVKPLESFEAAMKDLMAAGMGKAVLLKLTGDKMEDLEGTLLDDVSSPKSLIGRLPKEEACYVVWEIASEEGKTMLLVTWLPEYAKAKQKMKCSTFKSSVLSAIKERAEGFTLVTREVTEEDELTESLEEDAKKAHVVGAACTAPPGGAAMPGMGGGGFRPPPGAMQMPGMGGGGGYKPPGGGFKMPGM